MAKTIKTQEQQTHLENAVIFQIFQKIDTLRQSELILPREAIGEGEVDTGLLMSKNMVRIYTVLRERMNNLKNKTDCLNELPDDLPEKSMAEAEILNIEKQIRFCREFLSSRLSNRCACNNPKFTHDVRAGGKIVHIIAKMS